MTWLTWRLQRTELVFIGLTLVVLVGALLSTRADFVAVLQGQNPYDCPVPVSSPNGWESGCYVPVGRLYQIVTQWLRWFDVIPLFAALLLALPVVVELEHRTYRLAWTQGMSRARWLRSRLGIPALCAAAFAVIFGLIFHWWSSPTDEINGKFAKDWYDLRGTIPIGYTLFAVGLMLAVGSVLRRPVLTIITTAALYLAVVTPVGLWARPYLLPPVTKPADEFFSESTFTPGQGDATTRAWMLSSENQTPGGRVVTDEEFSALCDHAQESPATAFACYEEHGLDDLVQVITYHPESHYWPLQLIETGLYLAAGATLIGFAAWYVLRRVE